MNHLEQMHLHKLMFNQSAKTQAYFRNAYALAQKGLVASLGHQDKLPIGLEVGLYLRNKRAVAALLLYHVGEDLMEQIEEELGAMWWT